jgi:hypothetical protein
MQHAYRAEAEVSDDGTVTLSNVPFPAGKKVDVIVLSEADEGEKHRPASSGENRAGTDALSVLEGLIGSVEAPADWAAEHDHYLYGSPKRADRKP